MGSPSAGFDMFSITSNTITYSLVKGGFTGVGNSSSDPLFVDGANKNYRLQQLSPTINAGNNAANNEPYDLDGNTRKIGVIDMGAYELQCNPLSWVLDNDGDKYYIGELIKSCASPGDGYVVFNTQKSGDCNDNNASIKAAEPYWYDEDGDGHGYGTPVYYCIAPVGWVKIKYDCSPQDATKFNTSFVYVDKDGDGYTVGLKIEVCVGNDLTGYAYTSLGNDCNDSDASVPKVYYPDMDTDGYTTQGVLSCLSTPPSGWLTVPSSSYDCNDNDKTLQTPTLYWPDADGDGFGYNLRNDPKYKDCWDFGISYENYFTALSFSGAPDCDAFDLPRFPKFFCSATPPEGWAKTGDDCNDNDLTIYPGATEIASDGKDNNCNGTVDEIVCVPTIITKNIIVQLTPGGNVIITPAQVDNGSFDGCGSLTLSLDKTEFICTNIGVNIVTLTVTDINGNTASATATVTVEDNALPTVITKNITAQIDAGGIAVIADRDVDNGSYDACGLVLYKLSQTRFDCSNIGQNTVTLTVKDINYNRCSMVFHSYNSSC